MENLSLSSTSTSSSDTSSLVEPFSVDGSGRAKELGCFFSDSEKVVDFILSYNTADFDAKQRTATKDACAADEKLHAEYRRRFEKKLADAGLELEHEVITSGQPSFLKIHATFDFLAKSAEKLRLKCPVQTIKASNTTKNSQGFYQRLKKFLHHFKIPATSMPKVQRHYKAPFDTQRLNMFLLSNEEALFQPADRILMVWQKIEQIRIPKLHSETIRRVNITEEDLNSTVSIHALLNQLTYTAAYPLHDSECKYGQGGDPFDDVPDRHLPQRYWLFKYWASLSAMKYAQPVCEIYSYFGAHFGMYFAWLGMYTRWLLIPTLCGLIVTGWGIYKIIHGAEMINFICDKPNANWIEIYPSEIIVCRLCLSTMCPFKPLKEDCMYTYVATLADNEAISFFAASVCIWASVFVACWKRKQSALSIRQGSQYGDEYSAKPPRADYLLAAHVERENPITGEKEKCISKSEVRRRISLSVIGVLFYILLVLAFSAAVIAYRVFSFALYKKMSHVMDWEESGLDLGLTTTVLTSIISTSTIMLLSFLYKRTAVFLTDFERLRTDDEYAKSYCYKVFAFEFVNNYGALIYLAYFKGKFNDSLINMIQQPATDLCPIAGCFPQITIQLLTMFTVKQVINNITEVGIPYLKIWWSSYKQRKAGHSVVGNHSTSRAACDLLLLPSDPSLLFGDYLEMVIQYGYLVLFAAAFPLGPLFALANNLIEIRVDANKYTTQHRRPIPAQARDIGPWLNILDALTKLAVFTNALMIAFASDDIERWVYKFVFRPIEKGSYKGIIDSSPTGYLAYLMMSYKTNLVYGKNALNELFFDDNGTFVEYCLYRGYLPEISYISLARYCAILGGKIAFIIAFVNVVKFVSYIIEHRLPQISTSVKHYIQMEQMTCSHLEKAKIIAADDINGSSECVLASISCSNPTSNRVRDSVYFMKSGVAKSTTVDFVLAFEKSLTPESKRAVQAERLNSRYRKHFVWKLEEAGFDVELDDSEWIVGAKQICFLKIHAPNETLKEAAQRFSVRAPVALLESRRDLHFIFPKTSLMKNVFSKLFKISDNCVPNKQFYYTALYDRKRANLFLTDKEGFMFQDIADRIHLIWNVIEGIQLDSTICQATELKVLRKFSTTYFPLIGRDDEVSKLSIYWFLEHRVFTAAYPLHDSCYAYEAGQDPFVQVPDKRLPERYWLYKYWASWKAWMYLQPLDDIKAYFGVQFAMYFAFLGAYSKSLTVPAVLGLIATIYGSSVVAHGSDATNFFCNETLDYSLVGIPTEPLDSDLQFIIYDFKPFFSEVTPVCRLCRSELCPFEGRTASCFDSKISTIVDNNATALYAFLVCGWASIFLAVWRRKQCLFAHRWDVGKHESDTNGSRAMFTTQVPTERLDPTTSAHRPYLQTKEKTRRLVQSALGVLFYVIVVLGFGISIATYRTLSLGLYKKAGKLNGGTSYGLSTISHLVASFLVSFVIMLLSAVYRRAAVMLTNFERPLSDNDYLRSHIGKVFVFEFINNYGSLFYLAFIKGHRYKSMKHLPADADYCPMTGCLPLVTIQLATFFTLKQIVSIISQIIIPYLHSRRMRMKTGKLTKTSLSRAAQDYLLLQECGPPMFHDYLELVIQYGLVVLFAAAFPLAPLFALLNNLINIRVDAKKLLTDRRRPVPKRVRNIGPWLNILVFLTQLSMITNGLMIAFSSDFIDRWYYRLKLQPWTFIGYMAYNFILYNTNEVYGEAGLLKGNETTCIYRGYSDTADSGMWYFVLVGRLGFILIFQASLSILSTIVYQGLPKFSTTVKNHLQRREFVLNNIDVNLR